MSYAEDNGHDITPDDIHMYSCCGSDFDLDTMRGGELAWQCKDGTVMAISDMTTRHIRNCINLIKKSVEKERPWRLEYLIPLIEELRNRQFFESMRHMSDKVFNEIIHKGKK